MNKLIGISCCERFGFYFCLNEMDGSRVKCPWWQLKPKRQLRKVVVLCYFKPKREQKKDELVSANACLWLWFMSLASAHKQLRAKFLSVKKDPNLQSHLSCQSGFQDEIIHLVILHSMRVEDCERSQDAGYTFYAENKARLTSYVSISLGYWERSAQPSNSVTVKNEAFVFLISYD